MLETRFDHDPILRLRNPTGHPISVKELITMIPIDGWATATMGFWGKISATIKGA